MRSMPLSAVVLFAFLCTACVRSLEPFYERRDIYFDRALEGRWMDADGKTTWTVEAGDESYFVIDQTGGDGRRSRFEARLFRIGDQSFLDIVPVPAGDYIETDAYFDHALPIHSIIAFKREGCEIQMSYPDPTWLKTFLRKNPLVLSHADVDGVIVLTDSTKNMQAFFKKHLNAPGAYSKTEILIKKGDKKC